ncbi:metallophosphoesterase family protein [Oceanirhabdus sp. W0125-5]|uniref:metallophosphoesterase family protein n=1 Tax=Oceanirhabdus sp. W0125-5 TaxID=2999116 RepID=UPI0022F2A570|nr:YfcE family phosphodiesterase [Oceanirhabdus sp. W0125-5]WBW96665.1 YfcE family phosphodiesterase [Oceanirhabdus sp. W0125-5]
MIKKVSFISDIHGNIEALRAVLEDMKIKGIEYNNVYCTGDVVGYGPRPNEVIEELRKHNITCILGNHDKVVGFFEATEEERNIFSNTVLWTAENIKEENKQFLKKLKSDLIIKVGKKEFLLTHGSPNSISEYIFEDDILLQEEIASKLNEDILVFGHTHVPYFKKVNGKVFINSGSVGKPKDGDNRACYCVVEVDDNIDDIKVRFERVPYDIEKVVKEIEESDLLDEYAQKLRG